MVKYQDNFFAAKLQTVSKFGSITEGFFVQWLMVFMKIFWTTFWLAFSVENFLTCFYVGCLIQYFLNDIYRNISLWALLVTIVILDAGMCPVLQIKSMLLLWECGMEAIICKFYVLNVKSRQRNRNYCNIVF
jgi:hypothetical protein